MLTSCKKYFVLGISALALTALSIQAQNTPSTNTNNATPATHVSALTPPSDIHARGYILIDANSGQILAQKNATEKMPPASLTKLMTMYVISSALKNGKIHLTDPVPISKEAWRTGGSRMFVQVGTQVPVEELIKGIVIVSGNDAAVAIAEHIGGSQANFVAMMNQQAATLGMNNSHFEDVNGLPAPNHYTTPFDLAMLSRALINDFPDYYKEWYGQKTFEFNKIKQNNRNRLLWKDSSVDGLKTGHTQEAGYCLIASASRNDMRLISVVMGEPSPKLRTDDTEALLNWGFRHYSSHQLYAPDQPLVKTRVWMGREKDAILGVAQPVTVTIPAGQYKNLQAFLTMDPNLRAPIIKGKPYGKIVITLNKQPILTEPVIALQDNPLGNPLRRLVDHASLLFDSPDKDKK